MSRSLLQRMSRQWRQRVSVPVRHAVTSAVRRRRNRGRVFRPVFVVGAMGSGTTLAAISLAQRFECAGVVPESALQVSVRSFLRVRPIASYDSVAAYRRAIEPHADWSPQEGREACVDLYRSRADRDGDRVVDKGPNVHLVRAAFLARCFPDAEFLFIFRDPVANIEGFRRKWPLFGRASLEDNIGFYRDIHERYLDEAGRLGRRGIVVEYEWMVDHYEPLMDWLGDRLDLTPARDHRVLEERANRPGQGIRNVSGNRIGIVRGATRKAYERLSAGEVDEIRGALGPLHARMRAMAEAVTAAVQAERAGAG